MILRDDKLDQSQNYKTLLLYLFIYYMNIQNVSSNRLYHQLYNQPAVKCRHSYSRLYNWLYNWLYNRLQSVNRL